MRTVLAILSTVAALAATLTYGMEEEAAPVSAAGPSGYVLLARGVECEIVSQPGVAARAKLKLDPACATQLPLESEATYLVARQDGSLDLVSDEGKAVMRFGAAEGKTYVSFEPQAPLVRLVALD